MIYVVDDNELNVELLVSLLAGEGYEVQGFSEPLVALAAVEKAPPQLVLLDVVMPGLDGISFCREIKTKIATFIPVILITAQNDTVIKHKGLDAGADDFITKPFDRLELVTKVRNFLRTKKMYDQIQQGLAQTNHQMALAGQMQTSLFVPTKRALTNWEYEQLYYPAKYLSGDVIHIHEDQTGQALFFIADVAGHGVSSSLLAGAVKILVSEVVQATLNPGQVLKQLNQALYSLLEDNTAGYYVTAICGLVGEEQVAIGAAGHPPALASFAGQVQEFGQAGLPLGILPDQDYEVVKGEVKHLDWLLLFTDGLTECVDLATLTTGWSEVLHLGLTLAQRTAGVGLTDDVTALIIRRVNQAEPLL